MVIFGFHVNFQGGVVKCVGLEGCFSQVFFWFFREITHVTRCVVPVEMTETMERVVGMIQLGFR